MNPYDTSWTNLQPSLSTKFRCTRRTNMERTGFRSSIVARLGVIRCRISCFPFSNWMKYETSQTYLAPFVFHCCMMRSPSTICEYFVPKIYYLDFDLRCRWAVRFNNIVPLDCYRSWGYVQDTILPKVDRTTTTKSSGTRWYTWSPK